MGSVEPATLKFFDRAVPPKKPSSPKKGFNLMVGVLLGLVTAVGFAIASEHLDNTYTSPEELEDHLGIPLLRAWCPKTGP